MALPWWDTTLGPITIGSNQELSVALGIRSVVYLTAAAARQIYGIATTGGNVDGAVVVLVNVSNSASVTFQVLHESGLASAPANRLLNHNAANITTSAGVGGAVYRYFAGSINRWIMMHKT